MLRITRLSRKGQGLTIKVEGQILEPWLGTLRAAWTVRGRRRHRCLDLAAVTYADAVGVELLRELVGEGVEITACSGFVRELLSPAGH